MRIRPVGKRTVEPVRAAASMAAWRARVSSALPSATTPKDLALMNGEEESLGASMLARDAVVTGVGADGDGDEVDGAVITDGRDVGDGVEGCT